MKRLLSLLTALLLLAPALTGCGAGMGGAALEEPVTLTMWHVCGEQAASPMTALVDEFNTTLGKKKGVLVNVTLVTNSTEIGPRLLAARAGIAGAGQTPDLFFCHTVNAAEMGADILLDWSEYFSPEELETFEQDFLEEGRLEGSLSVLPVTQSTQLLFLNGALFRRFAEENGLDEEVLSTWEGFFRTAETYRSWSGGKPFCALDFPLRAMELNALSRGTPLTMTGGWYDFEDPALRTAWEPFAQALVRGDVVVSDLFANTQIMTGETAAGLSSSGAILYYNEQVTYENNVTEPLQLLTLPMPCAEGGKPVATRTGVGLCALKTTGEKAEAASLFAHWLTERQRNLDYAAVCGHIPVGAGAWETVEPMEAPDEAYAGLYRTMKEVRSTCTSYPEPSRPGYHQRAGRLYRELRACQGDWAARFDRGEPVETLLDEAWALFRSV